MLLNAIRYFSFLEQCKDAKACTVLLRGGSKDVLNEVERNLADAMQVRKNPPYHPSISSIRTRSFLFTVVNRHEEFACQFCIADSTPPPPLPSVSSHYFVCFLSTRIVCAYINHPWLDLFLSLSRNTISGISYIILSVSH